MNKHLYLNEEGILSYKNISKNIDIALTNNKELLDNIFNTIETFVHEKKEEERAKMERSYE